MSLPALDRARALRWLGVEPLRYAPRDRAARAAGVREAAGAPDPRAESTDGAVRGSVRCVVLAPTHEAIVSRIVRALGLAPEHTATRADAAPADAPVLCLGAAPPDDRLDVICAPPPGALRADPAAKAALWRQLRALRRRLAQG